MANFLSDKTVITVSEYSEISYFSYTHIIYIKWFPSNKYMGEREFHMQLDYFFNSAKKLKAIYMLNDAYDFNYPILENTKIKIYQLMDNCPVKTVGIIKSRYNLGYLGLLRLIKMFESSHYQLLLFETPKEGNYWIKNLMQ
jgi:hypothetical protein